MLNAQVFGVAVGGDLVFLDLGADEYTCLPGRAAGTNVGPGGAIDELSGDDAADLIAEGLAAFDQEPRQSRPLPARATADLTTAPATRLSARDLWTFVRAVADVRRLGRDPSVRTYLSLAAERAGAADPVEVERLALVVGRLLPWAPLRGQCLLRSAILVAFLARRSVGADWVFGVRTWPFRAHCWVQHDGVCLNDDADRLRAYTPILTK